MIASSPAYRPFGAFRFGLAMMVLLQHGLLLLRPGAREVFYDLELGSVAVTVFFALSGLIVAEAVTRFYAGRPAAFLANRVLRVVPLYLVALALTVALDGWLSRRGWLVALDVPLRGSPFQPRVLLGGLLEIVPGLPAARISGQAFSFIPFAWTLRVEFLFYLVAAGGCAALIWRRWGRVAVGVVVGGAYACFVGFLTVGAGGPLQVICVPFFAFGVGVFWRDWRGVAPAVHLGAASVCVLLAFPWFRQHGHPNLAFQLVLLGVLYAAILGLARVRDMPAAWRRWDRRLGELSYPIYISHGLVLTALASLSAQRGGAPYGVAVICALLLALALHMAVEQPLRRLRTRLRGAVV